MSGEAVSVANPGSKMYGMTTALNVLLALLVLLSFTSTAGVNAITVRQDSLPPETEVSVERVEDSMAGTGTQARREVAATDAQTRLVDLQRQLNEAIQHQYTISDQLEKAKENMFHFLRVQGMAHDSKESHSAIRDRTQDTLEMKRDELARETDKTIKEEAKVRKVKSALQQTERDARVSSEGRDLAKQTLSAAKQSLHKVEQQEDQAQRKANELDATHTNDLEKASMYKAKEHSYLRQAVAASKAEVQEEAVIKRAQGELHHDKVQARDEKHRALKLQEEATQAKIKSDQLSQLERRTKADVSRDREELTHVRNKGESAQQEEALARQRENVAQDDLTHLQKKERSLEERREQDKSDLLRDSKIEDEKQTEMSIAMDRSQAKEQRALKDQQELLNAQDDMKKIRAREEEIRNKEKDVEREEEHLDETIANAEGKIDALRVKSEQDLHTGGELKSKRKDIAKKVNRATRQVNRLSRDVQEEEAKIQQSQKAVSVSNDKASAFARMQKLDMEKDEKRDEEAEAKNAQVVAQTELATLDDQISSVETSFAEDQAKSNKLELEISDAKGRVEVEKKKLAELKDQEKSDGKQEQSVEKKIIELEKEVPPTKGQYQEEKKRQRHSGLDRDAAARRKSHTMQDLSTSEQDLQAVKSKEAEASQSINREQSAIEKAKMEVGRAQQEEEQVQSKLDSDKLRMQDVAKKKEKEVKEYDQESTAAALARDRALAAQKHAAQDKVEMDSAKARHDALEHRAQQARSLGQQAGKLGNAYAEDAIRAGDKSETQADLARAQRQTVEQAEQTVSHLHKKASKENVKYLHDSTVAKEERSALLNAENEVQQRTDIVRNTKEEIRRLQSKETQHLNNADAAAQQAATAAQLLERTRRRVAELESAHALARARVARLRAQVDAAMGVLAQRHAALGGQ
eukprot:TRINITY_DN1726_c0_g1_i1.p1 TRINITY_DN1726_c0_g1~~TRINITY_DN1726_c0_g1_i1.p1  ORF type:complete len:921 (+),score=260.62 TRINITY_DN1726_c0_g1_i1:50-2812(+)